MSPLKTKGFNPATPDLPNIFFRKWKTHLTGSWPVVIVGFLGLLIFLYGMIVIVGHEASHRETRWAVVDREKIIHDWAEAQAKSSRNQAEIEAEIKPFLEKLDQVMTTLSQERQMIFLCPSAVVNPRGFDMTGEIQKRMAVDGSIAQDIGASQ